VRLDFNRNLVRRSTDAARTHLEGWADVVEGLLENDDGVLTGLSGDTFKCTVNDALGEVFFAVEEDLVDELRHNRRAVNGISDNGTLGCGSFTRHYFLSAFAP
jgi:hypothetical protein